MKKITQQDRIINYLNDYCTITPLQAMRDLGCYRLSARIFDLKENGYNIDTKMVEVKNRYGGTTKVAEYSLAIKQG
jgi:hypothetical protein